ncbi:MAG TPA: maleylpyruvate isomerase family mycothiol-dependent enzyme [Actinospica sp.]|nr:maleylpyruvate isomerase family mycothiol-dependent enzyme [Actinospica sp.]
MKKTLEFPDLLRLIEERAGAFRAAVASAGDIDVKVPTCPEWTLRDLVRHLGHGRRFWAAVVSAEPGATPPDRAVFNAQETPEELESLLDWYAASVRLMLDALREAGPDRGCWTWWAGSQSPQNCGAVARHQLQEITMHTYDAQVTVGAPQALPSDVAFDGVEDFLSTCCSTTAPWPHAPASLDMHATEGGSWRLALAADGARFTRLVGDATAAAPAEVAITGTASELVLYMYDRISVDSLQLAGDGNVLDLLRAWEPEE